MEIKPSAIKGLKKIGDIFLPQNGEFPAYSQVADTSALSMLLKNAPPDDSASLLMVLSIFSYLPKFILKWLVRKLENSMSHPGNGILQVTYRQLFMGLRGILFSTYYSEFTDKSYTGKTPLEILEYKLEIQEN